MVTGDPTLFRILAFSSANVNKGTYLTNRHDVNVYYFVDCLQQKEMISRKMTDKY